MSAQIIPFDFEEQAVRVVMRDGDPWFVAADICRVLEIGNPSDVVRRLDDDETGTVNLNTLDSIEGIRGNPNARVINESGLYALVLTSRKDQARRFRKWITAEVLPAIRRTGRYEAPAAPEAEPGIGGVAARDAELWLSAIREARLPGGTRAGRSMWARSPLPPLALAGPAPAAPADPEEGRACVSHLAGRVLDLIDAAGMDDLPAQRALADLGLRLRADTLFVANAHPGLDALFAGTGWTGGRHRAALLALPGVAVDPGVLSLSGVTARGLSVPVALFGEAAQ